MATDTPKQQRPLDYFAIPVTRRDELADVPPAVLGVAVMLSMYCARECNGGVISGAKTWTSRQWLIRTGIDATVDGDSPLWHWRGNDLIVDLYSADIENHLLRKREIAHKAITARWNNTRKNAEKQTHNTPVSTPVHTDVSTEESTGEHTPYTIIQNKEFSIQNSEFKNRKEDEEKNAAAVILWPKSIEEVKAYMGKQPLRTVTGKELDECATRFFENMEERGWVTRDGFPVRNWKKSADRFLRGWETRMNNLPKTDPKAPSRGQKMRISGCNDQNDYADMPSKLTIVPETDEELPF